ncbi:unnamed protein product [Pseudo-nitzschia multistriata]|uniref:Arsenite methyltransferase n=1 Tax=Pseudo-nitzschia multistriata TaxID=183589 RepID=A0A448YV20_9STRA|nr:unnamed protein product [Pseudo-nitzschia multistriata]
MVVMQSKNHIKSNNYTDAVQNAYGSYVINGGDGNNVLKIRGENLGYDSSFLKRCNLITTINGDEDSLESAAETRQHGIQTLFMAFCGSGCPLRIDSDKHLPKEGDVIVDLGCGAGHDAILAGGLAGKSGRVVGIDFTQAMIDQFIKNAETYASEDGGDTSFAPFESVTGSLEDPEQLFSSTGLKKGCADIVTSNGVFNLCANKALAFQTAYDLLKPGGKFLLSDVCIVEENLDAKISCTVGDEVTS